MTREIPSTPYGLRAAHCITELMIFTYNNCSVVWSLIVKEPSEWKPVSVRHHRSGCH